MPTPPTKPSGALRNWIVILLIVVVGYMVYKEGLQGGHPDPAQHHAVGATLSKFQVEPLLGGATPLGREDLLGRVTLINFWGPWCGYCLMEMPHLDAIRKKYHGNEDFRLVAISYAHPSTRDLRAESAAALKRINVSLPVHVDPHGTAQNGVSAVAGWDGFPTTVLVDRQGVIQGGWIGYTKGVESQMQAAIERLLSAD